ncbi:MAG: protein phosphatase 2C domain-containing protein, partial [Acidobacteria bacterium]|nr:protein phosphatase 2C domain-containing protein [Acidobacteriota bacterium]
MGSQTRLEPEGPRLPGAGAAAAAAWQLVAASQPGSSHLCRGQPCADRCETARTAEALILVVADGAGSAARGADGAALAARTAARVAAAHLRGAPPAPEAPPALQEEVQRELVREILRRTREAVQEEIALLTAAERRAADRKAPLKPVPAEAFFSTLLLAILTEASLMAGNIGDGWVVTRDRQGTLCAVAPPKRDEYVNETFFLTSEGALDEAVIAVAPAAGLDAVALLSDGAAWFAIDLEQGAPSAPLFARLFEFAGDSTLSGEAKDRELAAFLASPAICRRTDDDKTFV